MKYSTRKSILAIVAAVMVDGPCMARDESNSDWTRLPDRAVPRWEAGSVVFENKLYVFGGYPMPTKACKRVDVFDNKITVLTSEGTWKHVGELPRPLSAAAAGILDGRLYLAGGSPNGATPQPAMWVRDLP